MDLAIFTTLREAAPDPGRPSVDRASLSTSSDVVIITEGLGNLRDRNYYTADAVRNAAPVFEGRQFYVDHPSSEDEDNRPERSIRDLAGYFYDVRPGAARDPDTGEPLAALYAKLKFSTSPAGVLAMEQVSTALDYQRRYPQTKDVYCGISINAGGTSEPGQIEDMEVNMVTEIRDAFSADIVTRPARGGRFLGLMREADKASAWRRRAAAREGRSVKKITKAEKERRVSEAERALAGARRASESAEEKAEKGRLRWEEAQADSTKADLARKLEAEVKADEAKAAEAEAAEAEAEAMVTEARACEVESENEEEREAREAMQAFGSKLGNLRDRLGNAGAGQEPGEGEMSLEDLVKDIQDDLEQLLGKVQDATGSGSPAAVPGGGEPAVEPALKKPMPGPDGMGQAAEDEGQRMRYQCSKCGEANEVLPPHGYSLMRGGARESENGLVTRLRRQIEAKEGRFVEANKNGEKLREENVKLRARVTAYERMDQASKLLAEAVADEKDPLPEDALTVEDLLEVEPHQWVGMIRRERRRRKVDHGFGAGQREAGAGAGIDSGKAAVAAFDAALRR